MNQRQTLSLGLLSISLLLGGCVVAPGGHPSYYAEPVRYAPPPPRTEYPGYAPAEGYVWIAGFWNWTGSRHEWVQGHWDAPRAGHAWVPHRWEQDGEQWRQTGGRWEPHDDQHRHEHDHERQDERWERR